MVTVLTAQPSRPLSLMSRSMPMKGGSACTYLQRKGSGQAQTIEIQQAAYAHASEPWANLAMHAGWHTDEQAGSACQTKCMRMHAELTTVKAHTLTAC